MSNSDVPRVKSKQNYEWFQDKKSVRLRLPLQGTSSKKIDVFTSDVILKVNVQDRNYVKIFDLQHQIDYKSKENTVVYANDTLEITLQKLEDIVWTDFIVGSMDKEQLKIRREQSFRKKEQDDQQFKKQFEDLKAKYDTHATREQMKQEDVQRNTLHQRKEEEKKMAEDEVYKDVNIPQKQETQILHTYKDIYSKEDFSNYEQQIAEFEETIPKVRQPKKIDVQFSEKIYPNVAVREQHFKEAPMPKLKVTKGEKAGEDLDNKNPLWLKDKGDEFFKNKDFYSSQNAYTQAFRLDKNFIECIANRSVVHMCLYNYDECYNDCQTVLDFFQDKSGQEQLKQQKYKDLFLKTKVRKAIALSWRGSISDAQELLQKILDDKETILQEQIRSQIEIALNLTVQRAESIKSKRYGDNEYKKANYEKAIKHYEKSIEVDENETSLGNLSITHLKLNNFEQCINYCNQAIEKVKKFIRFSNFNPNFKQSSANSNNFLIKLYLRKGKSQSSLGLYKEGHDTIKLAIQIDEQNKEARQLNKQIEAQLNKEKVIQLKQEAANKMKDKNVAEALEIYNQCLNILDQSEVIEFLALLLNRSACFLHLKQYDDIISSALRGLKIIRSYKNRIISLDNQKLSKEEKNKLNDYEVRFLIRRGNAYLQLNQIYNAKSDLEEAQKLDPNNEGLKQDLQNIRQQLN